MRIAPAHREDPDAAQGVRRCQPAEAGADDEHSRSVCGCRGHAVYRSSSRAGEWMGSTATISPLKKGAQTANKRGVAAAVGEYSA